MTNKRLGLGRAQVGLMDIDICGPSVPKMLGLEGEEIHQSNLGWSPVYVQARAPPCPALLPGLFLREGGVRALPRAGGCQHHLDSLALVGARSPAPAASQPLGGSSGSPPALPGGAQTSARAPSAAGTHTAAGCNAPPQRALGIGTEHPAPARGMHWAAKVRGGAGLRRG